MQINDPATIAEVQVLHETYERALIENDVAVLDSLFWDSPHAVRYGVTENLYGSAEVQAFRKNRPKTNLAREIVRLEITTVGSSSATVNLEFRRAMNGVSRSGRQSQFWMKFAEGWKIVSAHVSLMPQSHAEAAAERIGLPIDASLAEGVSHDFERIAGIASFLTAFPLDEGREAAPVFQP